MRIASLLCVATVLIGGDGFVSCFLGPRLEHHRYKSLTSSSLSSKTRIQASPEPLETEGEWSAYLDIETTGLVYYFNTRTGESRWEPPTNTFPQVYLTPRNRRRAQRVREEYLKAQQQQKQAVQAAAVGSGGIEEKKVSLLSTILDNKKREEVETKQQEPEWFAGLFEEAKQQAGGVKEEPRVVAAVETKAEKAEEPNWFANLLDPPAQKKSEEPNWFANLFETPSKKDDDEPNWFASLFETPKTKESDISEDEPNWFANLFLDSPKKSIEEPNWFASIFDDSQTKEQTTSTATSTESVQSNIVESDVQEPAKAEPAPTWVQDRWLGGYAAAQQPPPVVTEKPKAVSEVIPETQEQVEDDSGKETAGKKLFSRIFGRGKQDDGKPSGGDSAPVNGDVSATLAPPEVTEETKKKKPKGKEAVSVKEPPAVKASRVVEKVAPKIDLFPRRKVAEVPEIIVPEKETPIKIDMSAYILPHPMKILWGGEDAIFTQGRSFGVFDGVSGANKTDGVALYSKTLANQMRLSVGNEGLNNAQLTETMLKAVDFADTRATGATTALVASIDEDGYLNALNVGDSTCIVVRDGKVAAQTKEKIHFFECPYQLGRDLPDRPKDGTRLRTKLRRGDIVVMASDGVFDNISEQDVVKIVSSAPPRSSLMAKRIVDLSRRVSLDPNAVTPFAALAKSKGDKDYQSGVGGKLDDISCIVVRYT